MGVYVDDLIITGTNTHEIRKFKQEMMSLFRMTDLGLLSYYLSIEVKQTAKGISLNQSAYAEKVLEKCGMNRCNPCQVPIEARLKLSKVSSSQPVDATYYRSIVGSSRYLAHTRPDIAYAIGYVSQFMEKSNKWAHDSS